MSETPNIAVIGGGTGNFTVLSGLKPEVGEGLTAIVSMADDGGSTGQLRDEYGVLPPGDIRQCLVALSNASQEMRDLINYRIPKGITETGGLSGHTIGNLLIAAEQRLSDGDMNLALDRLGRIFDIEGRVLPVTLADRRLRVTTLGGRVIEGEHAVEEDQSYSLQGARVGFDKEPTPINERAEAAIAEADMVVIAPGDLYTSIAPALAVQGMREALKGARRVVQVANLMNRHRHTVGFTVADHAAEVERIVGAPVLDTVIYNTQQPNARTLRRYAKEGEYPLGVSAAELAAAHYQALGRPLLSGAQVKLDASDELAASRSLIRHDAQKMAKVLLDLAAE